MKKNEKKNEKNIMLCFQSDVNPDEDKLPKKKANTPVHQPKRPTPKSSTSKMPEIIRSPKKVPVSSTTNQTPERSTRELERQKVLYFTIPNSNRKFENKSIKLNAIRFFRVM